MNDFFSFKVIHIMIPFIFCNAYMHIVFKKYNEHLSL
jgi:hypothetical protein